MSREWHETFAAWAKPPSETEEAKAERAASMIREAIRASDALRDKQIEVYPSGSYRNNTNVKTDSDIDVAVVCRKTVFLDLPPRWTKKTIGFSAATYHLADLRRDVEAALVAKFGRREVGVGDKSFDIKENTGRLDADVAVFMEHRRYSGGLAADGSFEYLSGVEMRPKSDGNKRIINWHQHHYDYGVARNLATKKRFKRITRILKRLKGAMIANGSANQAAAAESAASFLIESIVFNAPDAAFNRAEHTYVDDVREVLLTGWQAVRDETRATSLVEVNRLKPLFGSGQAWTREGVQRFLEHAWHFAEFK